MAILHRTLAAQPPVATLGDQDVDTLIDDIISGRLQPTSPGRRRNRRRWLAGGSAVVVLAGGASVAALWPREKPSHPEQGIACHATLETVGNAQVVPPAADPLAACGQLWLQGVLPDLEHGGPATDVAPPLFACVGRGGGLDVFPNLSDPPATCAGLGLADAAAVPLDDPLIALQDRLVSEINERCVTADAAHPVIQAALDDVGLSDWTITVRPDTHGCVFAGEDSDNKTVFLITNPVQTTTT
jgi:hypothetical protein